MASDALVAPLRGVAIFQGLKPLQITEIARRAERVIFQPGDTIVEEGQDGDAAILVVAGQAVRVRGPGIGDAAQPVAEGSLIGEMAMLIETQHGSTVLAASQVKALRFTRSELLALMEEDPSIADHFVQKIGLRLHDLAAQLREIDAALDVTATHASVARLDWRSDAPRPLQLTH